MANSNSHKVLGINYFREKAIAAVVVLAVVLITLRFTGKDEKTGLADRDNDGVLDNVDKCPDDKGELKFEGCPIGKEMTNKASNEPMDAEEKLRSQPEGSASRNHDNERGELSDQEFSPKPPEVVAQPSAEEVVTSVKVESIDSQLKFDNKSNEFSWNSNLAKSNNLRLIITDANGNQEEIDVTRRSGFTYSPNKGSMQGMKKNAILKSGDAKVPIKKEAPKTFTPNCSAE
jgi:hypothetical protein